MNLAPIQWRPKPTMGYQYNQFNPKRWRPIKMKGHLWKFCMRSPTSQIRTIPVRNLMLEGITSTTTNIMSHLLLTFLTQNWWSTACLLSCNIKELFLETPMARPEYMCIQWKYFAPKIRNLYEINALIDTNGSVYINFCIYMGSNKPLSSHTSNCLNICTGMVITQFPPQ